MTPTHLKALQALELALRTGSFANAAEMLAITPAAVGQRVKALEDYLGVELLVRGRSGVRATPELAAALPHLRLAFAELEEAVRELDMQRGHSLHIAAASDFVELWLRPRLEAYRANHPHLALCINGEGDIPLRLGQADCEIGYGPWLADADTDRLFRDFIVPVCSPANRDRTMGVIPAAGLEGFPLLHLDFYRNDPAGLGWPAWCARNGVARSAPERGIRFQRIAAALDAVLADAGVTLCGLAIVGDHVEDGSIALPYPIETGVWGSHGFTARFRPDQARKPHVERFRAWLSDQARATRSWLSAQAGSPPEVLGNAPEAP